MQITQQVKVTFEIYIAIINSNDYISGERNVPAYNCLNFFSDGHLSNKLSSMIWMVTQQMTEVFSQLL